jgi:hypothetical protein
VSDLSRFLPLSQRGRDDESGVSSDRRAETDAATTAVLALLTSLEPTAWSSQAQRPGWSVQDLVAHLAWRMTTERWSRARQYIALAASGPMLPRDAPRAIASRLDLGHDESIDLLRSSLARTGRRPVADLAAVVIGGFDLARSTGRDIAFAAAATGAVALAVGLSASTPVKAVARYRTMVAVDAGWSIGHGPSLRSTAADIVLFLAGRSTQAPREIDDGPLSPEETMPDA